MEPCPLRRRKYHEPIWDLCFKWLLNASYPHLHISESTHCRPVARRLHWSCLPQPWPAVSCLCLGDHRESRPWEDGHRCLHTVLDVSMAAPQLPRVLLVMVSTYFDFDDLLVQSTDIGVGLRWSLVDFHDIHGGTGGGGENTYHCMGLWMTNTERTIPRSGAGRRRQAPGGPGPQRRRCWPGSRHSER